MFQSSRPVFATGRVLKADMLSEGMNYPEEMFTCLFQGYSDGILSGMDITITKQLLVVHPGILRYRGMFYYSMQAEKVPYQADGKQYYLRIRFHEEHKTKDSVIRTTELMLSDETEMQVSEMELARFKLKEGALLRQDYQNFSDFNTEHNTLNIIHALYAAKGKASLSPVLTAYFGRELLRRSNENIDISFALECLRGEVINRQQIMAYIEKRFNDEKISEAVNLSIYHALEQILQMVGREEGKQERSHKNRRILVE